MKITLLLCSIWVILSMIIGGSIYLIINYKPEDGWLFWLSIIGIIILSVLFIAISVLVCIIYWVIRHQDEILANLHNIWKGIKLEVNRLLIPLYKL